MRRGSHGNVVLMDFVFIIFFYLISGIIPKNYWSEAEGLSEEKSPISVLLSFPGISVIKITRHQYTFMFIMRIPLPVW